MNEELLLKILDSDLSKETKDKILSYWLLPPEEDKDKAPIQKLHPGKVGGVKRPDKEKLELRDNPKKKEEQKEMEETLDEVMGGDE